MRLLLMRQYLIVGILTTIRLMRLIRMMNLIKVRRVVFLVNLGITLGEFNIFNLLCRQIIIRSY